MKIRFLGTGAAEGAPAIYCKCEVCEQLRRRGKEEWHTRSQIVIDGELGIDFPPDAYVHALTQGVDLGAIRYLLITHSHMDHFYAHDFILRGYKYTRTPLAPLEIYGNAEVCKVFAECTRRELREEIAQTISMREIRAFEPFTVGGENGYAVTALPAQHSQTETAFVYLVEKGNRTYLHLTDTGRLPKETLDYLQDYAKRTGRRVDLVAFDCTFLFQTAGTVSRHMGLEDNKAMQEEMMRREIVDARTKYVITHYSHNAAPLSENLARAQKEYGYQPAFDGTTIEI